MYSDSSNVLGSARASSPPSYGFNREQINWIAGPARDEDNQR